MLFDPNRCFTQAPEVHRPCRRNPSWALPNQAFSSVCCAWANKASRFAVVDDSGRSTAVVKPYSRPLAHQITTLAAPLLWSSHIRNPWRIKSQAFANFWGSGPAKMMCFLRTGQQILQKLCV